VTAPITTAGSAPIRERARRALRAGLGALLVAALAATAPVGSSLAASTPAAPQLVSATSAASYEAQFLDLLNQTRAAFGLPRLVDNINVAGTSRSWSDYMRAVNGLSHDPNLAKTVGSLVPNWTRIGENVGVGYSVKSIHDAFFNSSGHRANMLGDYNQVGIGVVVGGDGRIWVTVRFAKGSLPTTSTRTATVTRRPDRVGVRRSNANYLRTSLSSGPANLTFGYGQASDVAVMGDWNGDGIATPGVFRNGTWLLRNSNSSGTADTTLTYGQAGDVPLVGDWDGNGTDTVGVWRNGTFMLRNANTSGAPSITLTYGWPSDRPLVGDWDGNGTDTVGVRRGNAYYLRNAHSGGPAHLTYTYGKYGDTPVTGDWDGNGTDTPGIRRGNAYYLRNAHAGGGADYTFAYGWATDQVVVGSW